MPFACAGAVYLFRRDLVGVWTRTQKLLAPVPGSNIVFGWHVALSDATLAVGAYGTSGGQGSVYVYNQGNDGTWTLSASLTASDAASSPNADIYFGWSLALAPNATNLLVGAARADELRGKAYAFVLQDDGVTWTESQILSDPAGLPGARLGTSVAMGRDNEGGPTRYLFGSKHKDALGAHHNGVAFLTTDTSGGAQTMAPPAGDGAMNGGSVAMTDGGLAAVGPYGAGCSPGPTETCSTAMDNGKAYVYDCGDASIDCALRYIISPPAGHDTSQAISYLPAGSPSAFGNSLALAGTELYVSSPLAEYNGAVYIYRLNGLSPPNAPPPWSPPPSLSPPSSPPPQQPAAAGAGSRYALGGIGQSCTEACTGLGLNCGPFPLGGGAQEVVDAMAGLGTACT